ncbi:cytochrome b-c1 complex subunit 10-like [Glandiceps talaboti]
MSIIQRLVGRKYIELARNWKSTGYTWTAVAGVGVIWLCNWQAVLGYVPFIKDQYKKDDEES